MIRSESGAPISTKTSFVVFRSASDSKIEIVLADGEILDDILHATIDDAAVVEALVEQVVCAASSISTSRPTPAAPTSMSAGVRRLHHLLILPSLVRLMEYRGKNYLVFEGDEPNSWRWAVTLDDLTTKTGEARTRSAAVTEVVLTVDRALSKPNKPR